MNRKEGEKLIGQEVVFSDSDTKMIGRLIKAEPGDDGRKWRATVQITGFAINPFDNIPSVFDRPLIARFVGGTVNVMGSYVELPPPKLKYFKTQVEAMKYNIKRLKEEAQTKDPALKNKMLRIISIMEKQFAGL